MKKLKRFFKSVIYCLLIMLAVGASFAVIRKAYINDKADDGVASESPAPDSGADPDFPEEPDAPPDGSEEPDTPPDGSEEPEEPEPTTYTIAYKMVEGGTVKEIPEFLFKTDGEYPTSYVEGEAVTVDGFATNGNYIWNNGAPSYTIYSTGNTDYEFYGWYLDEDCTQAFTSGETSLIGDVVLYAKVALSYWTPNY